MTAEAPVLEEALAPLLARPWLLVGVGCDLRGDDAFGPLLARRLAAAGLPALDGGTSPESFTGPVLRSAAEVVLLADAGRSGAPPGALRLLEPGEIRQGGTSTHDPGLRILAEYLEARRPLTVRILAAEAERGGLGSPPSQAILGAVERAARALGAPAGGTPPPPRVGGSSLSPVGTLEELRACRRAAPGRGSSREDGTIPGREV